MENKIKKQVCIMCVERNTGREDNLFCDICINKNIFMKFCVYSIYMENRKEEIKKEKNDKKKKKQTKKTTEKITRKK